MTRVWRRRTTKATELARAVLRSAAETGEVESEALQALATPVREATRARLALGVLAGGPHQLQQALELPAMVLRARQGEATAHLQGAR